LDCASLTPGIYALQDRTGDNIITWGTADIITKVWQNGQNGITISDKLQDGNGTAIASQMAGEDIEFVMNPDNHVRTLIWNTFAGEMWALNLADNCLAGDPLGTGKRLFVVHQSPTVSTIGPSGQYSGFEIDMNPSAAIPEPGTLLLLGTGALGALGWMRRRRMK
jgi:hypothetical protein